MWRRKVVRSIFWRLGSISECFWLTLSERFRSFREMQFFDLDFGNFWGFLRNFILEVMLELDSWRIETFFCIFQMFYKRFSSNFNSQSYHSQIGKFWINNSAISICKSTIEDYNLSGSRSWFARRTKCGRNVIQSILHVRLKLRLDKCAESKLWINRYLALIQNHMSRHCCGRRTVIVSKNKDWQLIL